MARTLARDDAGLSNWILLVALVVAVAIILGAYYAYFVPKAAPAALLVQQGDTVSVNYIGTFQESGYVFDTSMPSVAQDNATYPKAYSFTWRSSWSALSFTVGSGSTVAGFDQGVRGLAVGQSKTIVVPPSLGYGVGDPTKIVSYPLLQTVPVRSVWNQTGFTAYFHANPVSGGTVQDPVWGWTDYVTVSSSVITVTASPSPGQSILPYGAWTAKVLSIDDLANNGAGAIQVQNEIDPAKVDAIGGTAPGGQTFYLYAVDLSGGTYTLDFNKQTIGRTLVFQVTVVTLTRA